MQCAALVGLMVDIVQANMSASDKDKLPEDELLGQVAYVLTS